MKIESGNPAVTEIECHKFSAFASDLGLRPGEWPERIDTTMGNSQPFFRGRAERDADGDLKFVDYSQGNGAIRLRILND